MVTFGAGIALTGLLFGHFARRRFDVDPATLMLVVYAE